LATTADRENSLNDCLSTGTNYIPQIFEMLVKFRADRVGLVADIEKEFLRDRLLLLESLSFALYVKRKTPGKEKFYGIRQ
jgi:hypothetical protein